MRNAIRIWFLGLLLSSRLFAADGSSGCGPAWYVLKENSLLSSFLRNITNGISSPVVTIGMTLGTSNCAKHSIVRDDKKASHLVASTYEQLRVNAAQGDGQWLKAYAISLGCSDTIGPEFNQWIKSHYDQIFAGDPNPEQIVKSTLDGLRREPHLSGACAAAA